TKVSQNRQVRRAVRLSACASASVIGRREAAAGGKLTKRATAGEASHSAAKGSAAGQDPWRDVSATIAATAPITIAPVIRRAKPLKSRRGPIVACAAGTHSSKWRRLTPRRQS